MAFHRYFDHDSQVSEYICENCHRYMEREERRYYTPSTRDPTQVLCPRCYRSARTGLVVTTGFFFVIIAVSIVWALLA